MGLFWLAGGLLLVFIAWWRKGGGVKGAESSDRPYDGGSGFSFTRSTDAGPGDDNRDDCGPDDHCDAGSSDSGGSCDSGGAGGGD